VTTDTVHEVARLRCAVELLTLALHRRDAALVAIIDAAQDEPGGLNFANRAATLARDALGWEKE
jgi:hypothetical protein